MNTKFPKYMRFWIHVTSSECNGEIKWRYRLPVKPASLLNFHVSRDEESQRLQIPFLVIEEVLQQPILGFNAIKLLVNKSDNTGSLINSLTNNLVNTNRSNVSTLVNFISLSSKNEDRLVTAMPNTNIVPSGKLVNVP